MAILDPPYGITDNAWDEQWDLKDFQRLYQSIYESSSSDEMTLVTFCTIQMYHVIEEALLTSGWKHPRCVVWHKTMKSGDGGRRFENTNEFMVFAWKTSIAKGIWNYAGGDIECKSDLWQEPHIGNAFFTSEDGSVINNTQKPQSLLRRLIKHHSNPAGLVLDLCAGSHACLIACLWEERSCIAIEEDQKQHLAGVAKFRQSQDAIRKSLDEAERIRKEDEKIAAEEEAEKVNEGDSEEGSVFDPDQTQGPDSQGDASLPVSVTL